MHRTDSAAARSPVNHDRLVERLFEPLICGDRAAASHLVRQALRRGLSPDDLPEAAYRPLGRIIESLRRAEQLTDLAHRYATEVLASLVAENAPTERASLDHASAIAGVTCRSPSATPTPQSAAPRSQFVTFTIRDTQLTAHLVGPAVGEREVPIVRQEIDAIVRALGPRIERLVIDVAAITRLSSMALGMCLDLRRHAHTYGATMHLAHATTELAPLLRRFGLLPRTGRPSRLRSLFTRAAA
jgi:hypothetical protein